MIEPTLTPAFWGKVSAALAPPPVARGLKGADPLGIEVLGLAPVVRPMPGAGCDYRVIGSISELREYLKPSLEDRVSFGADWETTSLNPALAQPVGFSVSTGGQHARYVPVGHSASPSDNLPIGEVLRVCQDLDQQGAESLWYNAGYDLEVMQQRLHWEPTRWADVQIGVFLTDSNVIELNLKSTALRLLGVRMQTIDELDTEWVRLSAKQKALIQPTPLHELPVSAVAPYACLSGGSRVETEQGFRPIAALVKQRYNGRVWSYKPGEGRVLRQVTGWHRVVAEAPIQWLRVEVDGARAGRWHPEGATYTPDHRLLTERGWVAVQDLQPSEDRLALPVMALSPLQEAVAAGSVLGDGGLGKRHATGWGQLTLGHAAPALPYLAWKAEVLGAPPPVLDREAGPTTILGRDCTRAAFYRTTAPSHPVYGEWAEAVGQGAGKQVEHLPLSWLAMAIWFQDDGSKTTEDTAHLRAYDFSDAGRVQLADWLTAHGVETTHCRHGDKGWALHVRARSRDVFWGSIAPYVHPSMAAKLPAGYRDRWGSVPLPCAKAVHPVYAGVRAVVPATVVRRGSVRTSYCLDVEETHNFLTNGEIAHNCADADVTRRLRLHPAVQQAITAQPLIWQLEHWLVPVLRAGIRHGVYLDIPTLHRLLHDADTLLQTLIPQIQAHLGEPPITLSQRAKLGQRLFDLKAVGHIEQNERSPDYGQWTAPRTPTGVVTTNKKVLDLYRHQHPVIPLLIQYAEVEAQSRNYLRKLLRAAEHFQTQPWAHGRVRFAFNAIGVPTGRMKCGGAGKAGQAFAKGMVDVNGQSLPDHDKAPYLPNTRSAIVAPPGYVVLAADYSQIELRLPANLSKEPVWLDAFLTGKDIHLVNAQAIANVREPGHTVLPTDKKRRGHAKSTSFALLYGGDEHTIARNAGIPESDAKHIYDAFFQSLPKLKHWIGSLIRHARTHKQVRTFMGRIRHLAQYYPPEPPRHNRAAYHQWRKLTSRGDREAVNDPIQGGAADVFKLACCKLHWAVEDKLQSGQWPPDTISPQVFWVHDEVVWYVKHDSVQRVIPTLRAALEFPVHGWPVPLKAEFDVSSRLLLHTKTHPDTPAPDEAHSYGELVPLEEWLQYYGPTQLPADPSPVPPSPVLPPSTPPPSV